MAARPDAAGGVPADVLAPTVIDAVPGSITTSTIRRRAPGLRQSNALAIATRSFPVTTEHTHFAVAGQRPSDLTTGRAAPRRRTFRVDLPGGAGDFRRRRSRGGRLRGGTFLHGRRDAQRFTPPCRDVKKTSTADLPTRFVTEAPGNRISDPGPRKVCAIAIAPREPEVVAGQRSMRHPAPHTGPVSSLPPGPFLSQLASTRR